MHQGVIITQPLGALAIRKIWLFVGCCLVWIWTLCLSRGIFLLWPWWLWWWLWWWWWCAAMQEVVSHVVCLSWNRNDTDLLHHSTFYSLPWIQFSLTSLLTFSSLSLLSLSLSLSFKPLPKTYRYLLMTQHQFHCLQSSQWKKWHRVSITKVSLSWYFLIFDSQ